MMHSVRLILPVFFALVVLPPHVGAQTPLEREVLRLTNEVRTRPQVYLQRLEHRGDTPPLRALRAALGAATPVPPLSLSPGLSQAAADHVRDVGARGERGHRGADGSDPRARMDRYGSVSGTSGENISFGVPDAEGIVNQLLLSPGHRENILHPAFRYIGLAKGQHAEYRVMLVQTFAEDYTEASEALAAAQARQARLDTLHARYGADAVDVFAGAEDGSTRYRYDHGAADVVMFGATWCGACRGKARKLREQNVPHTIVYIDESRAARDDYAALLREAGHDAVFVPSFLFGEHFVPGNPSVDGILREVDRGRRWERLRAERRASEDEAPRGVSLVPGYRPGDASQWAEVTMGLRAPVADVGPDVAQLGTPVVTLQTSTSMLSRRLRVGLGAAFTEHDWSYAFGSLAYSMEAVRSRVSLVMLPGVRYGAELATGDGPLRVERWRVQPYTRLGLRLFHITFGIEAALHDPAASDASRRVHLGAFMQWARR